MIEIYISLANKIPVFGLILLASIGVIVGDYYAKLWSVNQDTLHLAFAFLGYFFSAFFFIPALLKEGLVMTSVMWSILSILGFLVIGLLIFKETLTVVQTIGVIFGVVSLLILSI